MTETVAFIINRDRFTTTKNMVEYLKQIPEIRVVIIDNDSAYPPLLEWYETNPCEIERLGANYGNFVVWSATTAIEGHLKPNFLEKYTNGNRYIVTDSDLDLSNIPLDFLQVLQTGMDKYSWACKVGFSLSIENLPEGDMKQEILSWEMSNWADGNRIDGSNYRKAAVDTTFALVNNVGDPNDFDRCIRVGKPYTAIHVPWTYTKENLPEDEKFFYSRITNAFSHYSYRNKIKFGL